MFSYGKSSFFLPLFIDAMSFAHQFYAKCLSDNVFDDAIEKMAEISASTFAKIVSDCSAKVTSLQSSFNEADHRDIFEFFSLVVEVSSSYLTIFRPLCISLMLFSSQMVCIMSIICGNLHAMLTISTKDTAKPAGRKKKKGKEPAAVASKNKQVCLSDLFAVLIFSLYFLPLRVFLIRRNYEVT